MADKVYRHELKYYINRGEAALLSQRLALTMDRDSFADSRGEYHIRSLYFDDFVNSAVTQKMEGIEERRKYRIRIYNYKDDNIKLERKEKQGQYVCKTSLSITPSQCEAIIAGDPAFLLRYKHPLAMDMYYQMRMRLLRPVVVVDYKREAYVHPFEDVRVTLDKDLRSGFSSRAIFNRNLPTVRMMEEYDMILEVKYNNHLPAYFHELIQLGSVQRSAISKYCICRKFE